MARSASRLALRGGGAFGPAPRPGQPQSAPVRVEDGLLPSRFFARVRLGREGAVVAVDRW
jgi:hypothetical protein